MAIKMMKKRTAKSAHKMGRYVLFGPPTTRVPAGVLVCSSVADLASFATPKTRVVVSYRRSSTEDLLQESLKLGSGTRMGKLLTLEPPRPESVPPLSGLFERVIGAISRHTWLPLEELLTVLSGNDAGDRFIGAAADPKSKTLALVRGNLATLVVPFSYFKTSGDGTQPDFSKFACTDFGLTVALGKYEASADGILYEFDSAYRQKLKKERRGD